MRSEAIVRPPRTARLIPEDFAQPNECTHSKLTQNTTTDLLLYGHLDNRYAAAQRGHGVYATLRCRRGRLSVVVIIASRLCLKSAILRFVDRRKSDMQDAY